MPVDTLYTYRCKACKTLAVAAYHTAGGRCIRCNLCRSPMPFAWSDPVTTDEQRALFNAGLVYNPGVPKSDKKPSTCSECGQHASFVYGVSVPGVGLFCSGKCRDAFAMRSETVTADGEGRR